MAFRKSGNLPEIADSLRASLAEWFHAPSKGHIVLAPGILIALRIFLHTLKIRSLLVTTEEYYQAQHFAGIKTFCCAAEDVEEMVHRYRPNAVLMSVVTWRGRLLDVKGTFRKIRRQGDTDAPLLIADYAHAGAIGFPPITSLNADIVVGDIDKWVMPPGLAENLAFLCFHAKLRKAMQHAFESFYLATPTSLEIAARWLSTKDLVTICRWIAKNRTRRADLLKQYVKNRTFAENIARMSNQNKPRSCIVWPATNNVPLSKLENAGLIWRRQDGIRIMCRDLALLSNNKKNEHHRCS